jgi:hypothetical protein
MLGTMLGATLLGALIGRRVRHLSDSFSDSFGVLQGALLGVVGLILAFGLSLAPPRYEHRREAIVTEANAIGTTYLRAQTLPEPLRSRSLNLLVTYTDSAIGLSEYPPGGAEEEAIETAEDGVQRRLWSLAGRALDAGPVASAPRLYVETLNEMIDAQSSRVAALNNDVPLAVLLLEVLGAAIALGLLAAYVSLVGRGIGGVLLASVLVAFLLFVTNDLDRPTRGLIEVPDTVLIDLRESMDKPPAAKPQRQAG